MRAGATLLYDSDPEAEEMETELKASAMLDAITSKDPVENAEVIAAEPVAKPGAGKSIILIDHEDSFVHTLGNYLRQTGADVVTLRSGPSALKKLQLMIDSGKKPDMVGCIYGLTSVEHHYRLFIANVFMMSLFTFRLCCPPGLEIQLILLCQQH